MQKKVLLTWAICLISVLVLAGCGVSTSFEAAPPVAEAEPTEAPAEEPTEAPAEEPTEAPVEEPTEAPVEEPTEAPVEEPTEAPVEEPTEAPVEEPTEAMAAADGDAAMPTLAYGSFPTEWLNRNVLGNPDATVLIEAYEEFL